MTVPVGYLVGNIFVASCTAFAVAPVRHPRSLARLSRRLGLVANELPFIACWLVLASTSLAVAEGDVDSVGGWVAFGVATLTVLGLAVVAWRSWQSRPAVERALSVALGPGWRSAIDARLNARLRQRLPYARILLGPWLFRRRDVERVADIAYGDGGSHNLLDVFRHRSRPSTGPTLVYLHGGGFVSGRKNREARPLLYRLASQGWVCVSANYRLSPEVSFPDHLIDVKRVIAWVRRHGPKYGADTSVLFLAGSSAGGHLASMAALTPADRAFQPGFEAADTSVTAAICLYGCYGPVATSQGAASSPQSYLRSDAPPFFVAQGDRASFTPEFVDQARQFVQRLRQVSSNPVVYAELPGGQHSFDLFHSVRFDTVVDGIDAFTAWVRSTTARLPDQARPVTTDGVIT